MLRDVLSIYRGDTIPNDRFRSFLADGESESEGLKASEKRYEKDDALIFFPALFFERRILRALPARAYNVLYWTDF